MISNCRPRSMRTDSFTQSCSCSSRLKIGISEKAIGSVVDSRAAFLRFRHEQHGVLLGIHLKQEHILDRMADEILDAILGECCVDFDTTVGNIAASALRSGV